MRIVNTYTDLQYPAIRFIINTHDIQSYKISIFDLHTSMSTTDFKSLVACNAFKLINKPNA